MKVLHKFTVSIPGKKEVTETVTRDGQPVKETREVDAPIEHTFVLKQLSRSETDSARLFNGASLKRAIDAGLITQALLVQNHLDGNGSLISKETARRIVELQEEIQKIKDSIVSLGSVNDNPVKQEKQTELLIEFDEATRELRAIESSNQAVFSATAEKYASERSNLWVMLNQTYIERNGKTEPYFGPGKFEDKEKVLEALEEQNDKLYFTAAEKISLYWGYYLGGLVSTPDDFVELDKRLAKQAEEEAKAAEEEKKKDIESGLKPAETAVEAPTA